VILYCRLRRRDDPNRYCGGVVGGAPDGSVQIGPVARIEDAAPGHFAMRCGACGRYVEVKSPYPMGNAA
jgi:hypothetical protein